MVREEEGLGSLGYASDERSTREIVCQINNK